MRFYKLAVLLIILSGLFLRLYKFQDLFYFAIDEEKAAYIIKGIIDFTHFPSVGHPSSIGFRLGPLLYYLMAPFYKIFGPYPYVWGYVSVAVSLMSMFLIFKMTNFIGKTASLIALTLYAFSYLNVLYDRRGWQVSFHSFIALIIIYSLLQLKNRKPRYIFLLTLALIFASHFEIATLLFIPLTFLSIWILKIKIPQKYALICILIFLLSHLGLLIFDLRHNFINTKYLLNYFRSDTQEKIAPNIPLTGIRSVYLAHNLIPNTFARTLFVSSPSNVAIQYANCPQYLNFKHSQIPMPFKWSVLALFILFFSTVYKNRSKKSDSSDIQKIISVYLLLLFGTTAVYTYIFQGEMAEYYMLSAFAYFFIVIGILWQEIKFQRLKFVFLPLFFIFILDSSTKTLTSFNPYGWKHKTEAVNFALSKIDNKPFTLDSFQTCWSTGGYRYLFTLNKHEPVSSYMDQYLSEYYKVKEERIPEYKVTVLTPEIIGENPQSYNDFKEKVATKPFSSQKLGLIEVYVEKLNHL